MGHSAQATGGRTGAHRVPRWPAWLGAFWVAALHVEVMEERSDLVRVLRDPDGNELCFGGYPTATPLSCDQQAHSRRSGIRRTEKWHDDLLVRFEGCVVMDAVMEIRRALLCPVSIHRVMAVR